MGNIGESLIIQGIQEIEWLLDKQAMKRYELSYERNAKKHYMYNNL